MEEKDILTAKEALEIEKLQIEIKKLKTKWVWKSSFWRTIAPFVIGILAGYFTLESGILDAKKTLNAAEATNLAIDIKEFKTTKGLIEDSINVLRNTKDSVEKALRETHQNTSASIETIRDQQLVIEGYRIECDREKRWIIRTNEELKKENAELKKLLNIKP